MKIISGGQTGVDRVALDFAIENGIEHGGWCPLGRLAEDGIIPERYHLQEIASPSYSERTERNVIESDATLIIAPGLPLSEGTLFTQECAVKHKKPCLVVHEDEGITVVADRVRTFLKRNNVQVLNVAGPRKSQAPALSSFVPEVLNLATAKELP